MGSDDYQAEAAQVVAAKAGAQAGVGKAGVVGLQARAATAVAHLGAREDGPNEDFVSLPAFKDYAMATFTVLISSAVVEGFFSQFAGMQDKKRPATATFASRAPKMSKQAKGSQREISTFFSAQNNPL